MKKRHNWSTHQKHVRCERYTSNFSQRFVAFDLKWGFVGACAWLLTRKYANIFTTKTRSLTHTDVRSDVRWQNFKKKQLSCKLGVSKSTLDLPCDRKRERELNIKGRVRSAGECLQLCLVYDYGFKYVNFNHLPILNSGLVEVTLLVKYWIQQLSRL